MFTSLEEDWNLERSCPYCNKSQKVTLKKREQRLTLNSSHRTFCPLANTIFKSQPYTLEGLNKLASQWRELTEAGVDSTKLLEMFNKVDDLHHELGRLRKIEDQLENYKRYGNSYEDIIRQNEQLKMSVNNLSSERSKWLRKLKRAGVKL